MIVQYISAKSTSRGRVYVGAQDRLSVEQRRMWRGIWYSFEEKLRQAASQPSL